MGKIYLFVLFNLGMISLLGKNLDLLGTADSLTVSIGLLLLISIPFIYVFGLKKFGYWEKIKNYLKHVKDVVDGELH